MKGNKNIIIAILLTTVLLAVVFLITVMKIYQLTLDDSKKSHQMKQMEMVKSASDGIDVYINNLTEDMRLLSFYKEVRTLNKIDIQKNVDNVFNHYSKRIVRTIFIMSPDSKFVYLKGERLNTKWISISEQFIHNADNSLKNNFWYSQVLQNKDEKADSSLAFLILYPFKITSNNNLRHKKGVIGYLVNFNLLMEQFVAKLKLNEGDFAWVLDGQGRLIYHPKHKDMLLRTIKPHSKLCAKCHASFETQKKMLMGESSIGEYTIGSEPTKIMAYSPIRLGNKRWVLAISTFLPKVTANLRDRFNLFFGLGVLILIVIFSFGTTIYLINAKRIRAEDANHLLEERQKFQDQLNHTAKLASIGELVDTVAHEINTPLGVIVSHVDAILLQKNNSKEYTDDFFVIKNQTKRISKYTRSLLNYSKRMAFNPVPVQIDKLLDECIFLLDYRLKARSITINKNYKNSSYVVYADRGQMEQLFINLLNNSIDAVDKKGEININILLGTGALNLVSSNNSKCIIIGFTDNGTGIKPEELDLVFEPFYTTKPADKGTGLGLSISKAIVQRHKGKIEVTSKPGFSTTFKIYLPLQNNLS